MENKKKVIGIILIIVGFVFVLNSFSGITGFVIAESVGKGISGVLGLVLIIGGALIFMGGKRNLYEILRDAVETPHGTLKMRDTKDALKYTDLKARERYTEELPKKSEYEKFLENNGYLNNEAAKNLFKNQIPEKLGEMIKIAKKCPYDVFPGEGDGNRVKNSDGGIITELGSHKRCNDKNLQRGRLKAMASGLSSWRT